MTFSQQMDNIDPEKFIKELKKINMTPEEKKIADAQELGEQFGEVIGALIATALIATLIWAILTYAFALSIAWVKVFGGFILFNIVKNSIIKSFKK